MILILIQGFAAPLRFTASGERQFADLLFPGQVVNLDSLFFEESDTYIMAVSDGEVAQAPTRDVVSLLSRFPRIAAALLYGASRQYSLLFEHMVSVGHRPAIERLAHLLTEFHIRARHAGLATEGGWRIPVTQGFLADLLGLSNEHVNRTIGALRQQGLIGLQAKKIIIRDAEGLARLGSHDATYLHLDGPAPRLIRLLQEKAGD